MLHRGAVVEGRFPLVLTLLGALLAGRCAAQEVSVEGVALTSIRSIDPDDVDFSDLAGLRDAIGGARVVVLGEQSHGEGAVFLAKARLVRFLHAEMGFDVLCWESNMMGCEEMNGRIADGAVPLGEAFDAVFPIWTRSAQVTPTLEYVRSTHETDRPLLQMGMDAQVTGPRTGAALERRAMAVLGSLEGSPPEGAVEGLGMLAGLGSGAPLDGDAMRDVSARLGSLAAYLGPRVEGLAEGADRREAEMVLRTIDDAAWFCRMGAEEITGDPTDEQMALLNERDRRMGDNLVWLTESYLPGRRIIVWAATRHAVHRQKEIEFPGRPGFYASMDSMGETAFARLGSALYTVGFTAGRGGVSNVFRTRPYPIGEPREGSIEAAFDGVGHPFLFADLRSLAPGHPWRSSQWMRPLGYAWQTAVWPDQMDGLVYIDTVFPSTSDARAPEGYALTAGG